MPTTQLDQTLTEPLDYQQQAPHRDPLGLTPLPVDNRQRFLRFVLDQKKDTLLPLYQITEVMQLALEDIFPVPDMPSCILGVCSWRGETLWLVDLNHMVGYEPLYQQSRFQANAAVMPSVMVVRSAGRALGLVVEQIDDVDLFDEADIHMEPGLCPPKLEPFVLGYCPSQGGTVLNVPAIVDSPLWQSHSVAFP
ncbi:MAG: chemotaxis protein CheW [Cyanobacteria bacterium J06634_6]